MILSVSWVKGVGRGFLGRRQGGLTLHLFREAVHVVSLVGVADAIGSHAGKLILVPVAAFSRSVDGVPARNPKWEGVTLGDRAGLWPVPLQPPPSWEEGVT